VAGFDAHLQGPAGGVSRGRRSGGAHAQGRATIPVRGVSVPVRVKEKIRHKDRGVFWTSLLVGPTCRGCRTMKT
jgi:hypothetical protein